MPASLTEALGILNWHRRTRSRRAPASSRSSKRAAGCAATPVSDTEQFPRTDAAIIVGVTDAEDRILLGSNALWERNRFSLLAGFVEPGESLEAAVVREVFEESGIRVTDPVYLGSQPWPFPASTHARIPRKADPRSTSTPTPDGAEILDLRWFSRDELSRPEERSCFRDRPRSPTRSSRTGSANR